MGLFSFFKKGSSSNEKKESPDIYEHPSIAIVPPEWITVDGKEYFRKYYYHGVELVDSEQCTYTHFKDCDPLTASVDGDQVLLYFHDFLCFDLYFLV